MGASVPAPFAAPGQRPGTHRAPEARRELRVPAGAPQGPSVLAVCTSHKKGIRKQNVNEAKFVEGFGIEGDAHGGPWHRQVSLLAWESIEKMRAKGLNVNVGSFAENITTSGIAVDALPIGQRLKVGSDVVLEITQIGKECHTRCAIYYLAGDCVMPKEGVFAKVIQGGTVKVGDSCSI